MKIGFIGLGIMGRPMAMKLVQHGYDVVVSDLREEAAADLVSSGAEYADKKKLGGECDCVGMILPNANAVRDVIFGEDGLAETMAPGSIIVDHSSVSAGDSRECESRLKEKGIRFLDAPVSGGETGAQAGELAVMVGGDEETYEELKPVFTSYAASVMHMGACGAGSVTKLANQIIVNNNIAVVSEALTFAKKCGVDPEKVYHAIRCGAAGSAVLDQKAPMMIDHDFQPGGTVRVVYKDIRNILNTAHALDIPVPYSAQLFEIMKVVKNEGYFEADHSSLVRYWEMLSGVRLDQDVQDEEEDK